MAEDVWHCVFNSWLSRQEVEETEVVLVYGAAKRPTADQINPVDWRQPWGHFQPFFCGDCLGYLSDHLRQRSWRPKQVFLSHSSMFPDPDLVMFVPEPHQSYDKIQHKEIYLYVLSSQKCSWLTFIRAAGSSFGNRVKTNVMKQHVIRSNSVTHWRVLVVYICVCGSAGGMTASRCSSDMQVKWSQSGNKR